MEQNSIGELLRTLRGGTGRSQTDQAAVLSELSGQAITRNEISRWESEKRLPTPFWQRYIAGSFGVEEKRVSRAVSAARAKRRKGRVGGVQRREFIGAMAALAIPLARTDQPTARRIGRSDVAELRRRTARLRRLDNIMGGAETFPVYRAEADFTQRLIRESRHTEDIERELLALLAEQQQQAGWAAFDHGQHALAEQLYEDSRQNAEDARALDLAGNALAYAAYQQTTKQQSGTALAADSYEVARRVATPKVSALLLERKAWAHATAGEAAEADRALNLARETLNEPSDRPEPDWVFWVDDAEIDIMAGRCWTELRRPLRAVPVLERVLAGFDDTHARDKSLYLTWLATSYLQAREVEQAAATLGHAADLAAGVTSVRPARRIETVARRLARHRSTPAVADLLTRLKA
ncbi:helix-turn-helix transcriptional regulator [Amycolatopsis sp. EV170708-02-1]|uniref:helix-turn-helix domain-containing protein n=1 Tax=Amycolatopsis sp. EV170708-02-1 TaxID=2919322 RepID=UPI001F0B8C87|nr:helix-turn-helix transcriptional regulator [Amycolatopsis sp. EV170708-02-1]UMP05573.1 helix-turn-helix domain-containing protein [Amycolatopsis sp. EV170708-02-1]